MHGKEPLYFLKEVKPVVMKLDSNGPPFGKLSPPLYIVHFPRGLLWESITSKNARLQFDVKERSQNIQVFSTSTLSKYSLV